MAFFSSDHKMLDRVSVVNRWCPWWLSIDDYAQESRFNAVCRPLSLEDYLKLPDNLKPYGTCVMIFTKDTKILY